MNWGKMLRGIKKLINQTLGLGGVQISRVQKGTSAFKGDGYTHVGNFDIKAPRNNPIFGWYEKYPAYLSQLRRVIRFLETKQLSPWVVDVGANVGDSLALVRCETRNRVVCIEGDPVTYRYLNENVRQFENVTSINCFCGAANETKMLAVDKSGWNTTLSSVQSNIAAAPVSLRTLSSVLEGFPDLPGQCVLKIDVEGFEREVLSGGASFVKKNTPICVIEINDEALSGNGSSPRCVLADLAMLGMAYMCVYESMGAFVYSCRLEENAIMEVDRYLRSPVRQVLYYDVILFPESLVDVYKEFSKGELGVTDFSQ